MHKILIVDDDPIMLSALSDLLEQEGYEVIRTCCGEAVLDIVAEDPPDLFLIDVGLPDIDGISLCRELRKLPETHTIPIIFFTGSDASYDVATALESGGDDFIRKPFALQVLAARIRAHLRRKLRLIEAGNDIPVIEIMPEAYQVAINKRDVTLTKVEFDLFIYLCRNSNKLHSPNDLLANVWHYPEGVGDAALVRNHIRNIRSKVEENPDRPEIIQSRHGRGYVVKARVRFAERELPIPRLA